MEVAWEQHLVLKVSSLQKRNLSYDSASEKELGSQDSSLQGTFD